MTLRRLIPLTCCVLASFGLRGESWDGAMAKLKSCVEKDQGHGMVVQLDRVDHQRIHLRLRSLGTTFRSATFQARLEGKGSQQVFVIEGKELEALNGTTLIEPAAGVMDLVITGSAFNPRILMKIPAEGQPPEVATVLIGSRRGVK